MKNVIYSILAFTLSAVVFTGCISEGNDGDCPVPESGNVTLIFSLTEDGKEVLEQYIENIDLILFRNGQYHSWEQYKASRLNAARSIGMELEPGTYTAVTWGNLDGNVRMAEFYEDMTPDLGSVAFFSAETGDPLWYAAPEALGLSRTVNPSNELVTFEVTQSGRVVQTLHFKHAHKLVDVYVRGYTVSNRLPVIEVDGDHQGHDFYMNHVGDNTLTLRQTASLTTTSEGEMANAAFYTTRLNADNTVKINIIDPLTHATAHSVTINEVLDLYEDFDLDTEITIPVLIEFFDGKFEVKPVTWLTTPSKPGLD